MELRPPAVRRLLEELEQLPGVGPRTATRLVHHLLRQPAAAERLAAALGLAAGQVRHCSTCYLLAEDRPRPRRRLATPFPFARGNGLERH